jgi:hypothetical protein
VFIKHDGGNNATGYKHGKGKQSVKVHTNGFSTVSNNHHILTRITTGLLPGKPVRHFVLFQQLAPESWAKN